MFSNKKPNMNYNYPMMFPNMFRYNHLSNQTHSFQSKNRCSRLNNRLSNHIHSYRSSFLNNHIHKIQNIQNNYLYMTCNQKCIHLSRFQNIRMNNQCYSKSSCC